MATIMSGVRGGLDGRGAEATLADFTLSLLNGGVNRDAMERFIRQHAFCRTLTFVVNNSCNLACRHCYLQVEALTSQALGREEWQRVFSSALRQHPDLICLSGKEIFLGNAGAEALGFLTARKNETGAKTRLGAITNGILLDRHRSTVEHADLDYLDISFDGGTKAHDALRGQGSFAAAAKNAMWAGRSLPRRLFASLTVQRSNFRAMRDAITEITALGIETIGCGFYHKLPYSDETLALQECELGEFFQSLHMLGSLELERPVTLLFDLQSGAMDATLAFMRSDWFDPAEFFTDMRGEVFNEFVLPNGLRLQFSFTPFPMTVFKSVRITPEGNYLAAEDTVDTRFYRLRSLGNVRDFGYDLGCLHEHAIHHPRVKRIFADYFENTLPQFQEAFAVHSLLSRQPESRENATMTAAIMV